jgi:hypothetical protein
MHCIALQAANIVQDHPGPIIVIKWFIISVIINVVICRKHPSAALVEAP